MQDARFQLMRFCVFIECSKIHSKILNDKNIIAIFGVIGQNFGPVYMHTFCQNEVGLFVCCFFVVIVCGFTS